MTAPTPQELIEHALATSRADACITIVRDSTSANLRWANNTLTTNGVMHRITVTVLSFFGTGASAASGSATGSAASAEQVTSLVEAAEASARQSSPAEDATELIEGDADKDWRDIG